MLAKRWTASIAVLVAGAALSAPAFADRGYHRGHYKHQPVVQHHYHPKPVVVHRPVVVHHVYRPAPRPVVVYHQPQPVYYQQTYHAGNGAAILVGAVLGAAIMHHVVTGY